MKRYLVKLIAGLFLLSITVYLIPSCNDAGIINPVDKNSSWVKSYGGVNSDVFSFMQLTNDGGSIITGYTISSSFGDNDVYAMKLDDKGNTVWSNSFGSSSNDQANCVTQTEDGNYIVVGQTKSFGATGFDIYVLKLNSGGNIIWSNIYKAPNDDYAVGVIEATEGGYVVAGYSNSLSSPGNTDVFLLKLSTEGDVQWAKSYGQTENDYATCIKKTNNGYIVGGYSFSFSQTSDVFIINFNSNGTIIWSRMYGGFGDDRCFSIEISGNDFIAAGYTQSFGIPSEDMFIFKMDNNGFLYHSADGDPRTFGDSALLSDRANSVVPTTDGGFLITGYVTTASNSEHLALIKLFGNMEFDWVKMYAGTSNDAGYSINRKESHYIIGGNIYASGSSDILTVSIKDDGTSCSNSINFTPLGGKPDVIEGAVTLIVNDVTSVFQKNVVQSQTGGTGFSSITNCTSQ
jgi:hypothetical protein